ncbi:hypothetical protein GW17_00024516 [Ensete ventricosum]|nr:hypothetical protein GW17_00024516 [Ensete ventricosum]
MRISIGLTKYRHFGYCDPFRGLGQTSTYQSIPVFRRGRKGRCGGGTGGGRKMKRHHTNRRKKKGKQRKRKKRTERWWRGRKKRTCAGEINDDEWAGHIQRQWRQRELGKIGCKR